MVKRLNCSHAPKNTYFTVNAFKTGEELKPNALCVAINFHNICDHSQDNFPFIFSVFSLFYSKYIICISYDYHLL